MNHVLMYNIPSIVVVQQLVNFLCCPCSIHLYMYGCIVMMDDQFCTLLMTKCIYRGSHRNYTLSRLPDVHYCSFCKMVWL